MLKYQLIAVFANISKRIPKIIKWIRLYHKFNKCKYSEQGRHNKQGKAGVIHDGAILEIDIRACC